MRRAWAWCHTSDGKALLALLVASSAVRLPLMPFPGFFGDMGIYTLWGVEAQRHLLHVYSYGASTPFAPSNYPIYPPLSIYFYGALVWIYDHIAHPLSLQPVNISYLLESSPSLVWLLKLPVLLGDLGLIAALYAVGRMFRSRRHTLVAAATYALCPAVLLAGVLWGQLDNVAGCFLVVAWLLALKRHDVWAGVALALAILVKPQPIIFVPLFLLYIWRWHGWRRAVRAAGAMGGIAGAFCAIYLLPPRPELFAFFRNIQSVLSLRPFTNFDAFNLWALLRMSTHPYNTPALGPLSTSLIGWGLFAIVLLIACAGVWLDGSPGRFFLGAGIVAVAFFDLTTMQHERYLYPALALFLGAALCTRRSWVSYTLYGIVCLTYTLNLLAYAVPHTTGNEPFWLFPPAVHAFAVTLQSYQAPLSALNLLVLLGALAFFVMTLWRRGPRMKAYQPISKRERAPVASGITP